jgi:DNA-binding IclR family transcriptional regulator
MEAEDRPVVDAAVSCFEVLDAVRTLEDPGVSDVARHLDRSKSGVYKHLNTLTAQGFLTRRGDAYAVGLGAWAAGSPAIDRFPMAKGTQTVDSLAASLDRSVALLFYEDGGLYYAYRNCRPPVDDIAGAVGDRVPLHATAAGKAVLAHLPPDRRDGMLGPGPLTAFTDRTVTDPETLRAELDTVREQRTATARAEHVEGLLGIAAPILAGPDDPIGAVSLLGTPDSLDVEDPEGRTLSLVVNASRSVESAVSDE